MNMFNKNYILNKAILIYIIISFLGQTVNSYSDNDVYWRPLPEGVIEKIAFGSCSNQYIAQPIWKTLSTFKPDIFISLGDIIYGDAAPPGFRPLSAEINQIEKMKIDYLFIKTDPNFIKFRQKVPMMATWDDHDYGRNDGGADFTLKDQSREIFLDFLGEPPDSEMRKTPGVYQSKIFGPAGRRVQVIILDTRYFRGPLLYSSMTYDEKIEKNIIGGYEPNKDTKVTMLGEEQWKWLEKQLKKPAEVRLLVSSIQVIAGEKGVESWGNLPQERKKLYDLIGTTGVNGLIILSGDVHFAEISKTNEGPYPLYDFTSSPMAQYPYGMTGWEKYVNSFRISKTYANDNFGLVHINWEAEPSSSISLKVIGLQGSVVFEHKISLDELQARKIVGKNPVTICPEQRPEICTQDYRPVCAKQKDGSHKTYSNACTACSEQNVVDYRNGSCVD